VKRIWLCEESEYRGNRTEIGNRDKVTCNICKTVTTGGIKRLKDHLVGGFADTLICSKTTTKTRKEMDTLICPKTTTKTRKEMKAYLDNNKRCKPIFLDDDSHVQ
jgi:hypothetical protein